MKRTKATHTRLGLITPLLCLLTCFCVHHVSTADAPATVPGLTMQTPVRTSQPTGDSRGSGRELQEIRERRFERVRP